MTTFNTTFLFQQISQSPLFHKSNQVQRTLDKIQEFFQDRRKHLLFIFGPSGCGKNRILNHYLQKNSIKCVWQQEQEQEWEQEQQYISKIDEIIMRDISFGCQSDIFIFNNFPKPLDLMMIEYLNYAFRSCICKMVFLLNSSIYYQKQVMKCIQYGDITQNNSRRVFTGYSIIQLAPYTQTELTKILELFIIEYKIWLPNQTRIMDQIIQQSNGDARTALHQLWKISIMVKKQKNKVNDHHQSLRFSIFHFLGKLLYNKRIDNFSQSIKQEYSISNISSKNNRKYKRQKKQKIRAMTYQQLIKYDPPFYFNPIQLIRENGLNPSLLSTFLHQNYLDFYNNINDVVKITSVFTEIDAIDQYKKFYQTKQEIDDLSTVLLTWGIMIYNKHGSEKKNSFRSLKNSGINQIVKSIRKKKDLIKIIYPMKRTRQMIEYSQYRRHFYQLDKRLSTIIDRKQDFLRKTEIKDSSYMYPEQEITITRNNQIDLNIKSNEEGGQCEDISSSDEKDE